MIRWFYNTSLDAGTTSLIFKSLMRKKLCSRSKIGRVLQNIQDDLLVIIVIVTEGYLGKRVQATGKRV